mgnify:FL=1
MQLNIEGILKLAGTDQERFWEILKGITTPRDLVLVNSQLAVLESLSAGLKQTLEATQAAAEQIQKEVRG